MAEDMNVLIKDACDFDAILTEVGRVIGHPLTKSNEVDWLLYKTFAFGLEIALFNEPGFDDDNGIPLSQYAYAIDIQSVEHVLTETDEAEGRRLCALLLASSIASHLHCECLVIENLHRVLATFLSE